MHAPLPPLAGPVRYADRPAREPEPEPDVYRPSPQKIEAPPPSPVFTSAPSVIVERRGRGAVFLAAAAAVVAVLAAIFVVMLIIGRPGGPAGAPTAQETQGTEPLPSRAAATDLTLSDHGGSVTLRWADPAQERAGFAVKMGATKDTLILVTGNLGAKPTFTITGLNAKFNYCFSVVTIYSGTELRDSDVVCTTRGGAKPSGTR